MTEEQKYIGTIDFLDRQGHWKSKTQSQKNEILTILFGNYYFYEPFSESFENVVSGKKFSPKIVEHTNSYQFKTEMSNFHPERPHKSEYAKGITRISNDVVRYLFVIQIFSKLKFIGLLLGLTLYFFDYTLPGLFLLCCLNYLDFGFFTFKSLLSKKVLLVDDSSSIWSKYETVFLLFTVILLIATTFFFYKMVDSIWITVLVFLIHYYLFPRIIGKCCKYEFIHIYGFWEMSCGIAEYDSTFTPPSFRIETSENQ